MAKDVKKKNTSKKAAKVQKEETKYPEYLYSERELDEYEAYIKKAFGLYIQKLF